MCQLEGITEDQVKLKLFSFSLVGRAKDWLLCLPNGVIKTWKKLEDKFLEIFLLLLNLPSPEQKLLILSSRKLSHFMTFGKDLNFCCTYAQITTRIIWSRCKTSSKVSRFKLTCYWMLPREVLFVK